MLGATIEMNLKLSMVSVLVGVVLFAPHAFGLAKPVKFVDSARRFPRSLVWGWSLMLLATAWFLFNLSEESIADFAAYKNFLMLGFAAIGIGSCVFVPDFLGARGLAVVLLLLAKVMVDAGRAGLSHTAWAFFVQVLAYCFVVVGIWLTISPWRLRDWIEWVTSTPGRTKFVCGFNVAVGLLLCGLGLIVF